MRTEVLKDVRSQFVTSEGSGELTTVFRGLDRTAIYVKATTAK